MTERTAGDLKGVYLKPKTPIILTNYCVDNNICVDVDDFCIFHQNISFDITKKLDVSNFFIFILL